MASVVLAMSGGVDSSVAASLLLESGHDVVGVFMRHGNAAEHCEVGSDDKSLALPVISTDADNHPFHKQGCCTASDAMDARAVADQLGIDFYALNLQRDFNRIMDYFAAEYVSGRTPNPCVMCNHWIKFGRLFDYADSIQADFVATGHYARIGGTDSERTLLRGVDNDKDQSYVLFGIDSGLLCRMMLPVGEFRKPEIRDRAEAMGLITANKRDSQEICFVSPGQHADFAIRRMGNQDSSGNIVSTTGEVVGQHKGIERFTIGQRKGIGVAHAEPLYVIKILPDTNEVVVGPRSKLAVRKLTASRANWLSAPPAGGHSCLAQVRYNSRGLPATVRELEPGSFEVTFDAECYGVAPGQAVVCYEDDRVLGGGWIDSTSEPVE